MTNITIHIFILFAVAMTAQSCARSSKKNPKIGDSNSDALPGHSQPGDDGDRGEDGGNHKPGDDSKPLMLTCDASANKKYPGLGGKELSAGRIEEVPRLGDRARIKPFSALTGEFSRLLKVTPNSLTTNAATFNSPPERWYFEPTLNGVNIFTAYRAAYEAALTYASSDAMLAEAPSEESATQACTTIAEKAWHRHPTEQEIDACKKVALSDTASVGDPKKRWAYAIAAILTATGFISY